MFWATPVNAASNFMPVEGSTIAGYMDDLYAFLLWASFISCVLVIGGFIYFAFKYKRRSEDEKTAYITHNNTLEFLWSFIPLIIFMIVFAWGWWLYQEMRTAPEDPLEIHVIGQQWSWDFLYKSGRRVTGEFYVPVDTPVKLIMTSKDVIHSFFVPSFRTKQDVVPGTYTSLWFEASKKGDFHVFCAEYCGQGHSGMKATVHAVSRDEYEQWLKTPLRSDMSPVEVGAEIFENKCTQCHTRTQERKVGPGMAGLFGRQTQLKSGKTLTVDENYLRESILNPGAKIKKGYPNAMTSFKGQFDESELMGLIEYLKTLNGEE